MGLSQNVVPPMVIMFAGATIINQWIKGVQYPILRHTHMARIQNLKLCACTYRTVALKRSCRKQAIKWNIDLTWSLKSQTFSSMKRGAAMIGRCRMTRTIRGRPSRLRIYLASSSTTHLLTSPSPDRSPIFCSLIAPSLRKPSSRAFSFF